MGLKWGYANGDALGNRGALHYYWTVKATTRASQDVAYKVRDGRC